MPDYDPFAFKVAAAHELADEISKNKKLSARIEELEQDLNGRDAVIDFFKERVGLLEAQLAALDKDASK